MLITSTKGITGTVTLPYTYTTFYVCPVAGHNIDEFPSSGSILPRKVNHYKLSLSTIKIQLYNDAVRELIAIGY